MIVGPSVSRSGRGAVQQTARLRTVFALLAMHGPALALLTAVPAVAAAAERQWALAGALAGAAVPPLIAYAVERRALPAPTPRKAEAAAAVTLAFALGALAAMPAFLVLGLSPADAAFEAVSAITTTGFTMIRGIEDWPLSALFLRGWLQWTGGYAFAALALALVVGPGATARRLGGVEGQGEDLLGSTRTRMRLVLSAYAALSVAAVVAGALLADDPARGAIEMLSAVSTGGFATADDSLGGAAAPFAAAVAAVILLGAISMTLLARVPGGGLGPLLGDGELKALLLILAAGTLGVIAVEASRPSGLSAGDAAFMALSAQSTAGFSTAPPAALSPAGMALVTLAMLIGGSVGSTSGGIKVFRLWFAASAARLAVLRGVTSPHAVTHLRVFGRRAGDTEGAEVLGLLTLYLTALAALWIWLMAEGAPSAPALFDAVSALSTVGLSAGVVSPDLPDRLKLGLAAGMLLGRVEFIAALIVLRPATWAPRRTRT